MKGKGFELDPRRIGMAVGIGVLVMLALSAASAKMVDSGVLSRQHMGLASAVILVLGGLAGALTCGRGGKALCQLFTGAGLLLVLMGLNLLLFDGDLRGLLPGGLALFGGIGAGCLLTMGRGSRKPVYRPGRGKYR